MKVEPIRKGMIIGDYPRLSSIWKKAVEKALKREYGGGTYEKNMARFKKEMSESPKGSNNQEGSAINRARRIYDKARAEFGRKVKLPKGTQIHHAFKGQGVAQDPGGALDASHLQISSGHAAKPGTDHWRHHRASKLAEQGHKNPSRQATQEMEAHRSAAKKTQTGDGKATGQKPTTKAPATSGGPPAQGTQKGGASGGAWGKFVKTAGGAAKKAVRFGKGAGRLAGRLGGIAGAASGVLNVGGDLIRSAKRSNPERYLREGEKVNFHRSYPDLNSYSPTTKVPTGYTVEKTKGRVIYRDPKGREVPRSKAVDSTMPPGA